MADSMKEKYSSGFTLVEMIIALLLSSLVLIGLIDVSANMVQRQFEGIRYGRVDSQTLLSLAQMTQTIEGATYLASPIQGGPPVMIISGCSNYSSTIGQINHSQNVSWFAYCVENGAGQGPYDLDYYSGLGCGAPSCHGTLQTLVYQNVWREPAPYNVPFSLNQFEDGVDIHFDIGNPNSTAMQKNPVVYPIDTAIIPNDGHFQ